MGSRGDFVMAMFCGSHLIVYGKGEDVGSPLDIFSLSQHNNTFAAFKGIKAGCPAIGKCLVHFVSPLVQLKCLPDVFG